VADESFKKDLNFGCERMRSAVILRLRIWMIGKNISGLNVTRLDMRFSSQ